ncbi:MAG TPA: hypothetical protein HPQ00_01845 [Magnetococcales bacterium]|nr:hypothetical protein [Magnetococcales bacterium]
MISLLCLSALTGGCMGQGGGSGAASGTESGPPAEVKVGKFLDGPTDGLLYRTSGNDTGATDSKGQFTYVDGETVTFYLGSLPLGSTTARGVVTPSDLVVGGHTNHEEVVNLSRFLQTLDEDGDPDNGITISAQARAAAQIHFPQGPDYSLFFKTDGHGEGFAKDSSLPAESVATKGLEEFFKDAGIFRYKKSNWIELNDIAGYLVPKSFAINHLRSTIQKQTESWTMDLAPVKTPQPDPTMRTAAASSPSTSTILVPGTAEFSVKYASTDTSSSSTSTASTYQYYDPNTMPLLDGKITFKGVSVTTTVTSTSTPTSSTTAATTGTTPAATTTTRDVTVTGDLLVTFTGAAVSLVAKIGTDGKKQGQLNIELLDNSSGNTATFTPDASTTESVSIPPSSISSLVFKATVNLETGAISDSKYSIKFANQTGETGPNLGTAFGTWSRGNDSGNIIFNELYRGLTSRNSGKTWELYGIGYTDQEMVAELSGNAGAYTQLSTNRTNLKLIADANTWSDKKNPVSLEGFIGFQIMIYDQSVKVDKLVVSNGSGGTTDVTETTEKTFANGDKRYFNLVSSNMAESTNLKKVLSEDLSEKTTTTTTATTTGTDSNTSGTETWGIADSGAGPGMISVVFTKNSALKSAGYAFQSTLSSQDTLTMNLVQ